MRLQPFDLSGYRMLCRLVTNQKHMLDKADEIGAEQRRGKKQLAKVMEKLGDLEKLEGKLNNEVQRLSSEQKSTNDRLARQEQRIADQAQAEARRGGGWRV